METFDKTSHQESKCLLFHFKDRKNKKTLEKEKDFHGFESLGDNPKPFYSQPTLRKERKLQRAGRRIATPVKRLKRLINKGGSKLRRPARSAGSYCCFQPSG